MKVKRFMGTNMQQALRLVSQDLGADAVILSSKKVAEGFEVVAALDYQSEQQNPVEVERQLELQRELERAKDMSRERQRARAAGEPLPEFTPVSMPDRAGAQLSTRPSSTPVLEDGKEQSSRPSASSNDSQYHQMMERMSGELSELKNWMVSHGGSAWDTGRPITWKQSQLWQRCQDVGLEPSWSDRIVSQVTEQNDMGRAWKQVLRQMAVDLPVAKQGSLDKGGVFALVGPTGAGKTTTIGKLAARFVIQHGADAVALVSIDSYRVAAHDQLRSVARILGVELHTVAPGEDLAATLETLTGKKKKRLVLVDTAGLASQDPSFQGQLSMLKQACTRKGSGPRMRCLLTLPLTSQGRCLQENYEHFKPAGLAGCIFTKLDECFSLGPAMSVAALTRLPLVMIADGPKIPDDLHYPDAGKLVRLAEQMARMARTRWQAAEAMSLANRRQTGSQQGVH